MMVTRAGARVTPADLARGAARVLLLLRGGRLGQVGGTVGCR